MAEDVVKKAGEEVAGIAVAGVKGFAIILAIIVGLLVLEFAVGVGLEVVENAVNFLVGLL